MIARPYLERWYHVAVVRSGGALVAYVDGRQVFTDSAAVGDKKTLLSLLKEGYDQGVHTRDSYGRTPLIYAIVSNKMSCFTLLLQQGSDIDTVDKVN